MAGTRKRGVDDASSETILDELDVTTKVAVATASPSIVSLHSRHVPEEMAEEEGYDSSRCYEKQPGEDIVFEGCGIIIECNQDVLRCKYLSTIITVANLFVRTNAVQPHQIMVDVYLFDGKLCKGRVLACDFHYNLAAVRIITSFPLKIATLTDLDDVLSIQLPPDPFLHRPSHSSLFNVLPVTNITHFWLSHQPSFRVDVFPGVFRSTLFKFGLNCNELCWVSSIDETDHCGGPVINSSGEVIGISVLGSAFLPVNIILRWWIHFKRCGQYRRPWLGVEVANLHSSHFKFLMKFMVKFPDFSTGVVVTKVVEDSPASISGICPGDVIVECNGKSVCSKLEFFGMIWDMIGESLEVDVLRVSSGKKLKLSLNVGETTSDKFYRWPLANWIAITKKRRIEVSCMRHVKRCLFPLRLSRVYVTGGSLKTRRRRRKRSLSA